MKTISASRVEGETTTMGADRALVWDAAVRVFHWLMVLCFAGAWLSADSERWRLLHVTLGYTMAGLVGFRLIWGLVGTRHARFASFVRGPQAVSGYLRSLLRGAPEHHLGHNPAGALAIVALLALTAVVTATGWAAYNELGGEWLAELHEAVASLMLVVIGVHVVGVVVSSWLHRENLVAAMLHGHKAGSAQEGIGRPRWSVAAVMVAGVLGFWWTQWADAPLAAPAADRAVAAVHHRDADD
jgi:cytochrome b